MVNWNLLQQATSPDDKPTPGWLFHEIIQDVRNSPKDAPDVAEYLMQCVCSDQLNIQLKAVLSVKHLASEDITFQQYMQACPGALKILEDIAAPPIVPQARSLEPQEVKTVRDATKAAIDAVHTPHTVEKSTEKAHLKDKIQGFGNFEPPPEESAAQTHGVAGQVAEFVGDSIGDMVDDFREKGAVGALKDATIDALDLVLDGVDTVWGWVAGKSGDDAPRICNPQAAAAGGMMQPGANMGGQQFQIPAYTPAGAPAGFAPPPPVQQPPSASNHYAAAFGQGVVGANNPVMVGGLPGAAMAPQVPPGVATAASAAASAARTQAAPAAAEAPAAPAPAPQVDLLSMDEPSQPVAKPEAAKAPAVTEDLLGDLSFAAPASAAPAAQANMLDL